MGGCRGATIGRTVAGRGALPRPREQTAPPLPQCPATCRVCSTVCADKDVSCHDWATKDECEKNPGSMLAHCPQSCGTCQRLEQMGKEEL